ncbi:hypothetical protein JQX13_13325 [Archangium violaceum]|uniref:hypothetical protein n=1 Tax=Archangium violaceum TaxID=83451 RepID=UPI00193C14DE|nr:hypothetical protein [Archangium violaceum]QRK10956.1 hypothetical protein JQX13_13325 [Archangium violaceum]
MHSVKAKILVAGLGLLLSGCARSRCSTLMSLFGCASQNEAVLAEDPSIRFPRFHEHAPFRVETDGGTLELDGTVLRAIQIAADDFLPPGAKNPPCWATQAAHTYRVIRQDDIVFVRIDEDPERCGQQVMALDSGAQYAISSDGRILRRLFDGQPESPPSPEPPDAGPRGVPAQPGVVPGYEPIENKPSPSSLPGSQDEG